uniref:molybdopterin dinucleotide binding domain-containing protein n=1 Tax=Nocardioides sp. TaxID=35761 RepID=UPI00286DD5FA
RDHYDLIFQTFGVRNTARFTPAVFEKEAGARHDWQIYRDVALATSAKLDKKPALKARAIMRTRLSLSPTRLIFLLLARARNGVTLKKLRANPSGLDLGPLQPDLLPERLQTRDHRLVLAPALVLADLERLTEVEAPDEGELLLIGRRHKQDCNSWMHNTERLTRGKARHQLLMHPADLAQRQLESGDVVTITSRVGKVRVEVAATDDMMPGVVSLPHGYGHARNPGMKTAAELPGVSINDLTDPERLDISGNAALSGVPVTVTG